MKETEAIRQALREKLRIINNDNPMVIREEIIDDWAEITGKTLYPAQSDNFLLNEFAAREASTKTQVNEALLQQYVRTASGQFLEELGYFWGLARIVETHLDKDGKPFTVTEDDEHFRRRILLAPEAITSAGTVGSYTYHALSTDLAILDVDVATPDDGAGKVHLTILGDGSVPDDVLANKVYRTLNSEKVAVLCVGYSTSPAIQIEYQLHAKITLYQNYDERIAQKDIEEAIKSYTNNPRKHYSILNVQGVEELEDRYKRLGVDIVESQVIEAIHTIASVYQVTLEGFPESGVIQVKSGDDYPFGALSKIAEYAVCTKITVDIEGVANE